MHQRRVPMSLRFFGLIRKWFSSSPREPEPEPSPEPEVECSLDGTFKNEHVRRAFERDGISSPAIRVSDFAAVMKGRSPMTGEPLDAVTNAVLLEVVIASGGYSHARQMKKRARSELELLVNRLDAENLVRILREIPHNRIALSAAKRIGDIGLIREIEAESVPCPCPRCNQRWNGLLPLLRIRREKIECGLASRARDNDRLFELATTALDTNLRTEASRALTSWERVAQLARDPSIGESMRLESAVRVKDETTLRELAKDGEFAWIRSKANAHLPSVSTASEFPKRSSESRTSKPKCGFCRGSGKGRVGGMLAPTGKRWSHPCEYCNGTGFAR